MVRQVAGLLILTAMLLAAAAAARRAVDYARQRCPVFAGDDVQVEAQPAGRDTGVYLWETLLENGARSGNYLRLRVMADGGAVVVDGRRQESVPPEARQT